MSSDESNQQAAGISNLQQNFSTQQKKISALKELVRKTEVAHGKSTTAAQDKVKSIAQRLTQLKSLARSRQGLDVSEQTTSADSTKENQPDNEMTHVSQLDFSGVPPASTNISTPNPSPNPTPVKPIHLPVPSTAPATVGTEKILLLRQQMEENKARMAQRASSKLHLEQMVTQLKEKFDSTQQCLEDTTELGRSMGDLSALNAYSLPGPRERHKSATDLSQQPFSLERERIKFLENRCRLLEKQLDKERQMSNTQRDATRGDELEAQLRERANELEARKASEMNLIAEVENLQQIIADRDGTIEELSRTRGAPPTRTDDDPDEDEPNDLRSENERLRNELDKALRRNADLERLTEEAETLRCELTLKVDKLQEQLWAAKSALKSSQEAKQEAETEKETDTDTDTKKGQEQRQESENEKQNEAEQSGSESAVPKDSDTEFQVQAEMAKQIQELQNELHRLRDENIRLQQRLEESERLEVSDASIAEKMEALEATIESQREDLRVRTETLRQHEEELMEKAIELNVLNANFKVLEEKLAAASKSKTLFSSSGTSDIDVAALQTENQQLKQKLDESNKAMIKLKLQSKQIEKQMRQFEKSSDLHAELMQLRQANEQLQQRLIELEDEKGQWQLAQVEESAGDNAEQREQLDQLEQRNRLQAEAISLLEQQKHELQLELRQLRAQLQTQDKDMEASRLETQLSEIRLEEQLREQDEEVMSLLEQLSVRDTQLAEAKLKLQESLAEKETLAKKLQHYIGENMELLDKVEKLSKSSSSAESIEIVERLTQQERAEIDEFNKRLDQDHIGTRTDQEHAAKSVNELTQTEMAPELTESLSKLREESSELMNKIELFTSERREVMDKMEHLTAENADLLGRIEDLMQQKELLETNALLADNEKTRLEAHLQEVAKEKDKLALQVAETTSQRAQLSQELSSLQQSSEVVAALDGKEGVTLLDKCEQSLIKLNSELETYRKANDKNAKFNASKKLAKEAKNAYTQLSELLLKVKEASTAVETVTVVETVVAVTAPNGKALAEYEQLTAHNRQLKATVDELRRQLELTEGEQPVAQAIDQSDGASEQERRCIELQSLVETLRQQLEQERLANEERGGEMTRLNDELNRLKQLSDDFDRLLNEKEMCFEQQVEQLTRIRKELEAKCETYEGESEILRTLVQEQKRQLIEAYQEGEHSVNLKLLELQQRDEQIGRMQTELQELRKAASSAGESLERNLQIECEKLRESLKANKALVAEQLDELSNKQETIDTLNQQLIELYKSMEENANQMAEKEEQIERLQRQLAANEAELQQLRKDNNEQKSVVDRLLNELHSHEHSTQQQRAQLEAELKQLRQDYATLEQHGKEQLDKMKKYAANLKKRTTRCQELEGRVAELEKSLAEQSANADDELRQLKEHNNRLTGELSSLQQRFNHMDAELPEIQEALQTKTMELLEAMEGNGRLELELERLKESLNQKMQESVQLQNALAASQLDKPAAYAAIMPDKDQELADKIESLQRTETLLADLQHEVQELREHQLEDGQAKIELQSELAAKDTCIVQLKDEMELLKLRHEELQQLKDASIARLTDDMHALAKAKQELEQVLRTKDASIAQLSADIALLQSDENAKANAKAGEVEEGAASTHRLDELNERIEQLHDENERLRAEGKQLSAKLEQLKAESADSAASEPGRVLRLSQEEPKCIEAQLREEIRLLKASVDEAKRELSANESLVTQLRGELELLKLNQNEPHAPAAQPTTGSLNELNELREQLRLKSVKFEKSKAVIKERNAHIQRLQTQLNELQSKLAERPEEDELQAPLKVANLQAAPPAEPRIRESDYNALKEAHRQLREQYEAERATFEETIGRLETLHDGIQAKLQEDMAYIETLEQENGKFKEKICKLEECVATFEERRASMERRANLLDAQMQKKADEFEQAEDELIYRLNALSDHDEVIARRLLQSQEEQEELQERINALQAQLKDQQKEYAKLEKQLQSYEQEVLDTLKAENDSQREQLKKAEAELQRVRDTYEAKLTAKNNEIEELESELSEQVQMLATEKRTLGEQLERARDDCNTAKDELVRLRETHNALEQAKSELERESSWLRMQNDNAVQDQYDLQELRMQSIQDRTELDNLRHQIDSLAANHELELQALRRQITESDALRMQVGQNQTDDQVFIESENKRLTDLLAEKEALLDSYQRHNLQLQMAAATAPAPPVQPNPIALAFGLSALEGGNQTEAAEQQEMQRLERDLAEKTELISRLQAELSLLQAAQGPQSEPDGVDNILPAPPMFFGSDVAEPSPFDEIIQVRHVGALDGAQQSVVPRADNTGHQIIEDLQRNVSDLEKHAQDLEHKLAQRQQREAEQEARLRETEARLREREQELQAMVAAQATQAALQEQLTREAQAAKEREQSALQQLQSRVQELEQQLVGRDAQIKELQLKLNVAAAETQWSAEHEPMAEQMSDMQHRLQNLLATVQERNREVEELKRALDQEKRMQEATSSIEKQIWTSPPTAEAAETTEAPKPSLEMFFGASSAPEFDIVIPTVSQEPVVEELIVPKKAYICQPKDEGATALDLGDDWGDSWGTGEAAAEEAYIGRQQAQPLGARQSLVPREQQLELQLQEQTERVSELEATLEQSEQSRNELQTKSGKLMKKLKEYKAKIDELQASSARTFKKSPSVESNSMFGDLDAAIQEELKVQIKQLETKLGEQLKLHEEHVAEKEKLLKRIDTLTAGHDRMVEMKDRQDMDMQMYKARIRELQAKVEQLESWDAAADNSESSEKAIKVVEQLSDEDKRRLAELEAENKDLKADQQELQALLDDEKSKVEQAHESISALKRQIAELEEALASSAALDKTRLSELQLQQQNLQMEVSNLTDENKRLLAREQQLQGQERQLREDLAKAEQTQRELTAQLEGLQQSIMEREASCNELQSQLIELRTKYEEQVQAIVELQASASDKEVLERRLGELQASGGHAGGDMEALRSANDELIAQLQEKEAENGHLKQKIQDLIVEDQTQKLVLEILTKNEEIHRLKIQVKDLEEDKRDLEHNLSLQLTQAMQKDEESQLQAKVDALQAQVEQLLAEKRSMEEELQVLNKHVLGSIEQEDMYKEAALELVAKNIEIAELRNSLSALKSKQSEKPATPKVDTDYMALNAKWESIVEQRCGEIAQLWKDHLEQREREFQAAESALRQEVELLRAAQTAADLAAQETMPEADKRRNPPLAESRGTSMSAVESPSPSGSVSASVSDESSKASTPLHHRVIHEESEGESQAVIDKMQAALESQEMEIVTLKEQLAIRSAEYARLAAQYDPFKLQSTLSHSSITSSPEARNNDGSLVPKAELDLALYVLHQRDLRCDELTVEIMSLLKERDMLQLKLSNTLRQMEAFKAITSEVPAGSGELVSSSPSDSPKKSLSDESADELNLKLSQLQTVDHSKDKIIKEDREQRIRQMERIQQDVSKMPQAAVSELMGTDLSRVNQSPSAVLMNWLWGNKSNTSDGNPPLN